MSYPSMTLRNALLAGEVLTARLQGDYNNNGRVDAADYVVWRNNVGTMTPLANDPIGDTIFHNHAEGLSS